MPDFLLSINTTQSLEKIGGANKKGQSRDTTNIGHTSHRKKTNKKQHRKLKSWASQTLWNQVLAKDKHFLPLYICFLFIQYYNTQILQNQIVLKFYILFAKKKHHWFYYIFYIIIWIYCNKLKIIWYMDNFTD